MKSHEVNSATHAQLLAAGHEHGVKTGKRGMDQVRRELTAKLKADEKAVAGWAHYPPQWVQGHLLRKTAWGALCGHHRKFIDLYNDTGNVAVLVPCVIDLGKARKITEAIVDLMNGDTPCPSVTSDASEKSEPKEKAPDQLTPSARASTPAA